MRVGVYPGSFNPPTVSHLAIAEAAVAQCRLDLVHLSISIDALGKHDDDLVAIEDRVAVLEDVAATRPWLAVVSTPHRLLADVAEGYDVLVVGADKWDQISEPGWYGSRAGRDAALARLPALALAPRGTGRAPGSEGGAGLPAGATVLDLHADHRLVSASGVRDDARHEWMLPEAAAFDRATGAWTDRERYRRHDPRRRLPPP